MITVHSNYNLPVMNLFLCQELLWSALKAGEIDMVVSDHSPCTPDLKCLDRGDFTQAWGGISSLQFGRLSLYPIHSYTHILSMSYDGQSPV